MGVAAGAILAEDGAISQHEPEPVPHDQEPLDPHPQA